MSTKDVPELVVVTPYDDCECVDCEIKRSKIRAEIIDSRAHYQSFQTQNQDGSTRTVYWYSKYHDKGYE